jgi:hypothetical protein
LQPLFTVAIAEKLTNKKIHVYISGVFFTTAETRRRYGFSLRQPSYIGPVLGL